MEMKKMLIKKLKEISITRVEGPCELCEVEKKFETWEAADKWLMSQQQTFPKTGGYDKHDFKVTWEDGKTYTGRLDCQNAECKDPDLSVYAHIKDLAEFYTGNATQTWMGEERYARFVAETKENQPECFDGYLDLLKNYLGVDANIVSTGPSQSYFKGVNVTSGKQEPEDYKTLVELFCTDRPIPDEIDLGIANKRLMQWDEISGPRVGDFIIMQDGSYQRISNDWFDGRLQTSESGSYYLGNGLVSMSGWLNPSIPLNEIVPTTLKKEGNFWFFHNDMQAGSNSIGVKALCRVYQHVPESSKDQIK